jgi:HSP20 family protein
MAMAVMPWDPVSELGAIQDEMNRMFNAFCDGAPLGNGGGRRWIPAMDLVETEDDFVLRADLPGVSHGDVKIELQGNTLTVAGERKPEHDGNDAGYHRIEREWGPLARSLTLPEGVDPERITARFDCGILELHVAKPEEHKPRRIAITVTGDQQTQVAA